MKTIVLGGGCFWCVEAIFQRVKGVEKVVSGYAGGGTGLEPNYSDLHSGKYNHAEVVEITYDDFAVSLEKLLEIFFYTHDPTTLRQPGTADEGKEYRSIILCAEEELGAAERAKQDAQEMWEKAIITEIKQIDRFYPAEDIHQDFYNRNPDISYCQVIINPKVAKFEKKFAGYLK